MPGVILRFLYFCYRPIYVLFLGISTTLFGTVIILFSFFDPSGNRVYDIARAWSRLNLFLAGVCIQVTGSENIASGKPYIVMTNHQSHLDVWTVVCSSSMQLRWVMKMELRKIPIFGLGCERMGQIYIDRSDSAKARQSLDNARVKIQSGASVVFFPEGTRSPDGRLLPFKKGGFVMAIKTGAAILPMTINGSRALLPKKSLALRPGVIRVKIHPPVPADGYNMENKAALLDRVRGIIEAGLDT